MNHRYEVDTETHEALLRLIAIARRDSGQSRRVADFLLAWWNATTCGGFDFTDLWGLDHDILLDVRRVLLKLIIEASRYPDTLGCGSQFEALVAIWRPALIAEETRILLLAKAQLEQPQSE